MGKVNRGLDKAYLQLFPITSYEAKLIQQQKEKNPNNAIEIGIVKLVEKKIIEQYVHYSTVVYVVVSSIYVYVCVCVCCVYVCVCVCVIPMSQLLERRSTYTCTLSVWCSISLYLKCVS